MRLIKYLTDEEYRKEIDEGTKRSVRTLIFRLRALEGKIELESRKAEGIKNPEKRLKKYREVFKSVLETVKIYSGLEGFEEEWEMLSEKLGEYKQTLLKFEARYDKK